MSADAKTVPWQSTFTALPIDEAISLWAGKINAPSTSLP